MKIGVSAYSFARLTGPGRMSVYDVIAKAHEMAFEAIEFAGLAVPEGETAEECAKKVRDTCAALGMKIPCYAVGADLINGSGGNQDAEIERVKGEVRIARILGVSVMRHDAAYGPKRGSSIAKGFADAVPLLARGCRAVTEYAADMGIRTTVENHGFFCQDSERVEMLINAVAHPNFGVLVDIGNFLCADEDPAVAVGRLAPYVVHAHAKDFHVKQGMWQDPGQGWFRSRGGNFLRGAIIGHGDVPVLQCLRLLKGAGYDGFLSIEFEGMEDALTGIALGRDNLRRYLNAAG